MSSARLNQGAIMTGLVLMARIILPSPVSTVICGQGEQRDHEKNE